MIPKDCKRLAEVDFPIAEVSKHAAREKEARCGHIPKIHIWPAARPTASSRAVLLALLWPDPCDPLCPAEFKAEARKLLSQVGGCNPGITDEDLRKALLRFIADFANWYNAAQRTYIEVSRALVKAAHGDEPPLVVDPFAGGGSIPLEALRLGCEAFASDLNPVALLIQKVVLEDIPRQGPKVAEDLRRVGAEIKREAEQELADFYPKDPDGATPITYLWARTVRCESPNCGAEIPLVRSFWLCKKAKRRWALKHRIVRPAGGMPHVEFEVFVPQTEKDVPASTVTRAKATCVACGAVLSPARVRAQLTAESGGADVVLDAKGRRTGGARMLAVVTLKPGEPGRHYRLSTERDYESVLKAQDRLAKMLSEWYRAGKHGLCPVPDEPLPLMSGTFNVPLYGMNRWGDLFTARQKVALVTLASLLGSPRHGDLQCFLALNFSKIVDMNNALSSWQPHAEIPAHMLTRFALPMKWDFSEAVPTSDSSGTVESAINRSIEALPALTVVQGRAIVQLADAADHPLPDNSAAVWFTDPPYYFAVPYADISDFFFVWIKRALPGHSLLRDPFDSTNPLTPKERELCEMAHWDPDRYAHKDQSFFEEGMRRAFAEGRRVLSEDGVGSVVFAHKTTEGWEALLSGMIRGGWTITGSWPIATEMGSRLRARDSAALATSVHLVCRPRPEDAPVGDWADVLRELPMRVGDWMERLQAEKVRGADLVFACIGPALEIYSRYSKVVDPNEIEIPLGGDATAKEPHKRGYLSYVWEVVGRTALDQVLGTSEARARNGAAGALEEDARLTALFLWTLQSTNGQNGAAADPGEDAEDDTGERMKMPLRAAAKGFSLVFDVVRRFAQPLGINLPLWEHRIVTTEKGVVRLLPVSERARQLFGNDGVGSAADWIEDDPVNHLQLALFPEMEQDQAPRIRGRGRRKVTIDPSAVDKESMRKATTLDRVHAAMLLQAGGQANALRALIKAEQDRGPDFLRLANALSALYPKESEEKRLLDAMLLAVPR